MMISALEAVDGRWSELLEKFISWMVLQMVLSLHRAALEIIKSDHGVSLLEEEINQV